ncbi:guanylate kinase [Candidatus Peregrinibacteria bacterium]|nr:guanylate kinase [Candidatus Peregrinibacteria bacterium]
MSNGYKGLVFVISGPSGVGKGSVIKEIRKKYPQFVYPISVTTRAMRPGEEDGKSYFFVSKEDFERGIEEGAFLEYALVHGLNFYGTLKKPIEDALKVGKVVVREVDVQGAMSYKELLPADHVKLIFIKAKDKNTLITRIAKRGELPMNEVEKRMESAAHENELSEEFDFRVLNAEGELMDCVDKVENYMLEEIEKMGIAI